MLSSSSSSSSDDDDQSLMRPIVACNRAGLDPATYASFFSPDGRTQTTCAAGARCGQKNDEVSASTHHCMSCGLRMHAALFCGALFDSWYMENATGGSSFIPTMLPPHGRAKMRDYADRLGETGLYICQRCIDDIAGKMSSSSTTPTPASASMNTVSATLLNDNDIDDDSSNDGSADAAVKPSKKRKQTKKKTDTMTKKKKTVDWKRFSQDDWEMIEVSVTKSNIVQGNETSMTHLRGMTVDGEFIPTVDISLTSLKKLASRFGIKKGRSMLKITLCEKIVVFRGEQEKKQQQKKDQPDDDDAAINDYRFLNVMFSAKFITRFATRAKSLTKRDFDQGFAADQELYTDLLVDYNRLDVAAYGLHAHVGRVSQQQDPSVFRPISPTQWKKAEAKFKQLYALYEKSLRIWTVSGTNCDYEELRNLCPEEEGSRHICVYMHYFVRDHKQLLELCTASLPKAAFRDSTTKRSNSTFSPTKGRRGRGRRGGAGGNTDKEKSSSTASNQFRDDAMISIAEKNGSIAEKEKEVKVNCVLERATSVRKEMRAEVKDRGEKMKELVTHCGSKAEAKARIEKEKKRREQQNIVDGGDVGGNNVGSDDDDEPMEPDSQETTIGYILEHDQAISDLKDLYSKSMEKAKTMSADKGEDSVAGKDA